MLKPILAFSLVLAGALSASGGDFEVKIRDRYLNFPVSHRDGRCRMTLSAPGHEDYSFDIRIASDEPDYWVFLDMSGYKGKTVTVSYPEDRAGLASIYQDDEIAGTDSLYREYNRPQIHYTQKRGWNNDPNGLVFYEGEYHLFYQHNPFEREWGNMHWGHAVSRDLVHWEELPLAMFPDEDGTAFSGSAVIDYGNTSGFGKDGIPPMVAIYTADSPDRQVQCLAYSLDKGRSWTKYDGNPVIDSKEKWNSHDTRDPKVFRYAPTGKWIMVLNERDGHSIYSSGNLKDWTFESHVTGFWECPELIPLPVDGNPNNVKWVMYGASGTYMIGDFDGKAFTPEHGKYYYTSGTLYAAQTIGNIPESDGRRIQIAWGRVSHPGMPFNGTFLIPTELSLRTGKDGIRLYSKPVKEFESIQTKVYEGKDLTQRQADEAMKPYAGADVLRVKATINLSHATSAGLSFRGQNLLDYDMNGTRINGVFYSPEDMTSMELSFDMYIDRTLVEAFIDGGAYSYSMEFRPSNDSGFSFWGNNVTVKSLEVYTLESIWE